MSEDLWPHLPLSALSLAIKDGSHGTHKRVANGVPFLSAKNVTESGTLKWGDADDRISEEDYTAICSTFTPQERDLLLTIVGTLGRRAIFDGSRVAFQRSVAFVRPDARKILPRYLFHAAGSHDFGRQLVRRSNATAQAGLYLGELAKTTIPTPPPPDESPDQTLIAAVLDTVDEAIEKTEAVIAKLRQVRAGLLHDLLTRGLDHNGQLRDPIAHPEQFQDSPLGQIPKEWTASTLAPMCSHIGSGLTPRGGQDVYTSAGIMLIRSQNVTFDGLLLDDVALIPEEIHLGMLRSEIFAHDVLFNITGASIGRCCPMPPGLGTANVNQHVCALRVPKATAADAKYLASLLASPIGQRQMDSLLTVGNRQGLNYQQLGSFVITWPKEDERKAISLKICAIEDQIYSEEKEHGKLALLKSGLMIDLLTGRVRVPETIRIRP